MKEDIKTESIVMTEQQKQRAIKILEALYLAKNSPSHWGGIRIPIPPLADSDKELVLNYLKLTGKKLP